MRADVFTALSRLDGAAQDALETGQLVSRSITDIGLVQGLLAFMPALSSNVLLFVDLAGRSWCVLSPLLTLVALAVAPALWFVAIALAARRCSRPTGTPSRRPASLVGQVEAAVTGVRVVKGFGQEQRELDEVAGASRTSCSRSRMRVVRLQSQLHPGAAGGSGARSGRRAAARRLARAARRDHAWARSSPSRPTSPSSSARSGSSRRCSRSASRPGPASSGCSTSSTPRPTIFDAPDAVDLPGRPGRASSSTTSRFGYATSRPVLRELRLTVAPGETLALVGGAGSGKSTVVAAAAALLRRPRRLGAGRRRRRPRGRLASLRSRLGVVFEDSFLFSDSIARQHRLRTPRRDRRAGRGRGPRGRGRRVHPRAARRLRHRRRRARADPVRRPAAAHRPGPGAAARPAGAGARRRHLRGRPARRGRDPRDPAPGHGQPHDPARRPPPLHARAGRPHRRARRAAGSSTSAPRPSWRRAAPLFRLLLSGPGDDAEGVEAGELALASASADEQRRRRHGRALARRPAPERGRGGPRPPAAPGARAAGATGGRVGDVAAMPATPELLAQVAALPPARDVPEISDELARPGRSASSAASLLRPVRGS